MPAWGHPKHWLLCHQHQQNTIKCQRVVNDLSAKIELQEENISFNRI